jgi:flagellar biogenesis protein FliO
MVRLIVGLAVVLAVIYGVYWLLRSRARSRGVRTDGRLDVVATAALGPNKAVHLVRVGDELVLLGTGENVTPIRVYTAAETLRLETQLAAEAVVPLRDRGDSSAPFVTRFTDELRRRTARG